LLWDLLLCVSTRCRTFLINNNTHIVHYLCEHKYVRCGYYIYSSCDACLLDTHIIPKQLLIRNYVKIDSMKLSQNISNSNLYLHFQNKRNSPPLKSIYTLANLNCKSFYVMYIIQNCILCEFPWGLPPRRGKSAI
jgi:hypothetical protein